MKNKLLHALSNRPGPFQTAIFSQSPSFVPKEVDLDEQAFRQKVFLDITNTDYYLKAYLALIHAFPDLERIAKDTVVTYTMMDFPPRGVTIDGAEFLSAPNVVGQFTDPPITSLPVNQTYEVRYVSAVYLDIIAVESGLSRRSPYHLTGNSPTQIMRLEWQDFPFDGPIRLNQEWATGAKVTIAVEPSRFPYDALWQRIQGDLWLNKKIIDENLMNALQSTLDLQEKMAIALMVLVMDNDSVFGTTPVQSVPPVEIFIPSVFPNLQPITIISHSPLPPANVGAFYSFYFQAIGGSGRYHWSIASGTIPAGLQFSIDGHLYGTPQTSQIDTFTVTAIDY